MDTMSYIIGRNSAGGGGTGSTPSWSDVTNKPFNTIGSGLEVDNGALIFDERELGDYVKTNDLAAVATSGDYDDLSNKPTIPQPTSVSVTQTLSTGTAIADIDVDGVTTTLYAPAGGGNLPIESGTGTNSAIIANANFNTGASGTNSVAIGQGTAAGQNAISLNGWGAYGTKSLSWGSNCNVYGNTSAGLGEGNIVRGNYSVHIGYENGSSNLSMPNCTYLFGQGLKEQPDTKAIGRGYYNDIPSSTNALKYVDFLGNGTSNNARSNAEATDWSGNKYLAGDIYVNVTDWTDPQNNSVKLEPVSIANTLSSGNSIAELTIGNTTTTINVDIYDFESDIQHIINSWMEDNLDRWLQDHGYTPSN